MSLPAVTKHLKVLQRAGLISQSREAQWRPCRLRARPMREAAEWMEPYRQHWEQRFDRLDDYLRVATGKPVLHTRKKKEISDAHTSSSRNARRFHELARQIHQAQFIHHRTHVQLRPRGDVPRVDGP